MNKPNLFILGAAKSATTSIADYLRRLHRLCFCPANKEPNYFVFKSRSLNFDNFSGPVDSKLLKSLTHFWSISDLSDYLDLYKCASQRWKIDASVRYLYFSGCCNEIKNFCTNSPTPKFIISLRKPSSRAISHYLMMKNKWGLEDLSFSDAVAEEENRIAAGWDYDWHYLNCGRYYDQIKRYIDIFGRENVHILYYENLVASPRREIIRLLGFLRCKISEISLSMLSSFPSSNAGSMEGSYVYTSANLSVQQKLKELDREQLILLDSISTGALPW